MSGSGGFPAWWYFHRRYGAEPANDGVGGTFLMRVGVLGRDAQGREGAGCSDVIPLVFAAE